MKNSKVKDSRFAFTLLEILVVIVVIVILSGMVFNIGGIMSNRNEIARTRKIVEATANAIEEYRAIYGMYPPVPEYPGIGQPVRYEYAVLGKREAGSRAPVLDEDAARSLRAASADNNIWSINGGILYTFGLTSFIFPRIKGHAGKSPPPGFLGTQDSKSARDYDADPDNENAPGYDKKQTINQWSKYNEREGGQIKDSRRDFAASRRMVQHLGGSIDAKGKTTGYGVARGPLREIRTYTGVNPYVNMYITIRDAWERELMYQSHPPYNSFKIWSVGPDGESGTPDDIVAGQE